jgi:hypothetical protein
MAHRPVPGDDMTDCVRKRSCALVKGEGGVHYPARRGRSSQATRRRVISSKSIFSYPKTNTRLLQLTMTDNPKHGPTATAAKPRKRFIGNKSTTPSQPGLSSFIATQVPQDILSDVQINEAIQHLPSNYSFEIHKTIYQIRKNGSKMVALQMPEGLQMYACTIADIVERCAGADADRCRPGKVDRLSDLPRR